jgi:hypothetical protein
MPGQGWAVTYEDLVARIDRLARELGQLDVEITMLQRRAASLAAQLDDVESPTTATPDAVAAGIPAAPLTAGFVQPAEPAGSAPGPAAGAPPFGAPRHDAPSIDIALPTVVQPPALPAVAAAVEEAGGVVASECDARAVMADVATDDAGLAIDRSRLAPIPRRPSSDASAALPVAPARVEPASALTAHTAAAPNWQRWLDRGRGVPARVIVPVILILVASLALGTAVARSLGSSAPEPTATVLTTTLATMPGAFGSPAATVSASGGTRTPAVVASATATQRATSTRAASPKASSTPTARPSVTAEPSVTAGPSATATAPGATATSQPSASPDTATAPATAGASPTATPEPPATPTNEAPPTIQAAPTATATMPGEIVPLVPGGVGSTEVEIAETWGEREGEQDGRSVHQEGSVLVTYAGGGRAAWVTLILDIDEITFSRAEADELMAYYRPPDARERSRESPSPGLERRVYESASLAAQFAGLDTGGRNASLYVEEVQFDAATGRVVRVELALGDTVGARAPNQSSHLLAGP